MRVSLRQPTPPRSLAVPSAPLLARSGPRAIVGSAPEPGGEARPLAVSASGLFGPRGAVQCPTAAGESLVVCDTGHHRLLIWKSTPGDDLVPADLVIGQPDFVSEGRNGKRDPGTATLNVPTGVAFGGGVLAVADAWNHRVLLWFGLPEHSNQPADVVVGQADFASGLANRGASEAAANTLHWCYGVAILDGNLVVADTGNRRVLVWDGIPRANGRAADLVIGQSDLTTRDENAGKEAGPLGMRWPHSVARCGERLLVADAGNNRILVWDRIPRASGVAADFALGQADFTSLEHNRGHYLPNASSLNMPYGVAASGAAILAADTANSRLLGWQAESAAQPLEFGCAATGLAAQPDFGAKGDNRWQSPVRDSVCWPYGITLSGDTAVISDSGNNRVLLWDLDPCFAASPRAEG